MMGTAEKYIVLESSTYSFLFIIACILVAGGSFAIGHYMYSIWIHWTMYMWRCHDKWMIDAYRRMDAVLHWCSIKRPISYMSCLFMLTIIGTFTLSLQYSVSEHTNFYLHKYLLWSPMILIVLIHLMSSFRTNPYQLNLTALVFRLMAWYSACVLGLHFADTLNEEVLLATLTVSLSLASLILIGALPLSSPYLSTKPETIGWAQLRTSEDAQEAKVVVTHECGHVLLLGLAKDRLVSMTLDFRPKNGAKAFVHYRMRLDTFTTRYGVLLEMLVSSGGEMAEYLMLGERSVGSETDRDQQRQLAKTFAKFSSRLPYDDAPSNAWELEVRDIMIQSIIDCADDFALNILKEQRSQLEFMINHTQDKDVFCLTELLSMMEGFPVPTFDQHLLVCDFDSKCYALYQKELVRLSLTSRPDKN